MKQTREKRTTKPHFDPQVCNMQNQGKLSIQNRENGEKPSFDPYLTSKKGGHFFPRKSGFVTTFLH